MKSILKDAHKRYLIEDELNELSYDEIFEFRYELDDLYYFLVRSMFNFENEIKYVSANFRLICKNINERF